MPSTEQVSQTNAAATNSDTAATTGDNSNHIDSTHPDRVIFRDGNTESSLDSNEIVNDAEPIAPIRPPIHSKTKNWYSSFCNRWASLLGVG